MAPELSALELIESAGVVPVVVLDRADSAPALGDALLAGGLPVAVTASRRDCFTGCSNSVIFRRRSSYRAAHGALAMTTPGDTSTARLEDVRRLVERPSARIQR